MFGKKKDKVLFIESNGRLAYDASVAPLVEYFTEKIQRVCSHIWEFKKVDVHNLTQIPVFSFKCIKCDKEKEVFKPFLTEPFIRILKNIIPEFKKKRSK